MSKCTITYIVQCENPNCGSEFEILEKTYSNRLYIGIPIYCPDCMIIYKQAKQSASQKNAHAKRSPERKAEIKAKQSLAAIKRYKDPAEHEKTSNALKNSYANMTPEEKNIRIKSLINYHKNETIEAKESRIDKQIISINKFWNKQGPEKRKEHGKAISNGHHKRTPEQQKIVSENDSKAQIKRYAELTFEDKLNQDLKDAIRVNEMCGVIPIKFDTKTEKQFYQYIRNLDIGIGYHFYNIKIHPEFYNIFKDNPYSKYNYSSPYHEWDFKIFTYKTPILIDIDGMMHDPSRIKYNVPKHELDNGDWITMNCYYDLRRPYQTDGYPAYVVLCYDNIFDGHNKVIDINNPNREMYISDLLNIIDEYNDPKYLNNEE